MNAAGLKLIKEFESCRLEAYPDPKTKGDPWTCGWGSTEGVTQGTRWTQDYADMRLLAFITDYEKIVNDALRVTLNENQLAALVSITSNVGKGRISRPGREGRDGIIYLKAGYPSTLLTLINKRLFPAAANEFLRWVSPGSDVEAGLRRRREAERALFLEPVHV